MSVESGEERIVVIGAGPTGLGAAYRLKRMDYRNWQLYEQADHAGGLSASFVDPNGFTWDLGGHVFFSGETSFHQMLHSTMKGELNRHSRSAWIFKEDRWIPYPFQQNLRYLPRQATFECLSGLAGAQKRDSREYENFEQWIFKTFGDGIANHFMIPYNRKVWSHCLTEMGADWVANRVSTVKFEDVLRNVILEKDDIDWGPNRHFSYPAVGGTGEVYRRLASDMGRQIQFKSLVTLIDLSSKTVTFQDGSTCGYDILISSMPLDVLLERCRSIPEPVRSAGERLAHNRVMVVGIGIDRPGREKYSWAYFPDDRVPFYRVTCLSNYADRNVPDINGNISLLAEISLDKERHLSRSEALDAVIAGMEFTGVMFPSDRSKIVSTFMHEIDHAYPIPTLSREEALTVIQHFLESKQVYSRGRFGAWKYECGNMDHSFLQGEEVVDRILLGKPEQVLQSASSSR